MNPREIDINNYDFALPEAKIPSYPNPVRDQSKLLVFKAGSFSDSVFSDLPRQLDKDDLLVMNETKVIPARLIFKKVTGGVIEIFCLEPINGSHQDAMSARHTSTWYCMVGGAKKWKGDEPIKCSFDFQGKKVVLEAHKISSRDHHFEIKFVWNPESLSFSEILEGAGEIPLPPYFNRKVEEQDKIRYQTVFARFQGSVAAPTAALHFTEEVFTELSRKEVGLEKLILHVGAGTFRPVSAKSLAGHDMHGEKFSVSLELIENILNNPHRRVIAVGTTTMRTLESLHWLGVKILTESNPSDEWILDQWAPYDSNVEISLQESLSAILEYCRKRNMPRFEAITSIIIAPGFKFRICNGLITNFHLPKSTLLVLVSAFIGEDWNKVYRHALDNGYRFLSYGDSSLLWR